MKNRSYIKILCLGFLVLVDTLHRAHTEHVVLQRCLRVVGRLSQVLLGCDTFPGGWEALAKFLSRRLLHPWLPQVHFNSKC